MTGHERAWSEMRVVVVCGSRSWRDWSAMEAALRRLPRGSQVVHGDARGADRMAGSVAERLGHYVARMPAEWERYGKSAGMRRNNQMLTCVKPDLVIAFWDGSSRGTRNMIERARRAGVRVRVYRDGPAQRPSARTMPSAHVPTSHI